MRYIMAMAKAHATLTGKTVRDSKSGRIVIVRGAGALKGKLTLKKSVDLTQPIASQAGRPRRTAKTAVAD